jgi:hypothetical protein
MFCLAMHTLNPQANGGSIVLPVQFKNSNTASAPRFYGDPFRQPWRYRMICQTALAHLVPRSVPLNGNCTGRYFCMSIEHQDCGSSRCVYGVDWPSLDVLFSDAYPNFRLRLPPYYCLKTANIQCLRANIIQGLSRRISNFCMSIEHQDCGSSRCVYGVDWSSLDVLFSDAYPQLTYKSTIGRGQGRKFSTPPPSVLLP